MKIRVIRGFAGYEPGQVFDDWPAGMCEILAARGVIEPVGEEPFVETAESDREVERAGMQGRRKRK